MARTIDPKRFTGSSQERLEKAAAAWCNEPGSTLRLDTAEWSLTRTLRFEPPKGADRVSGRIVGPKSWYAIDASGLAGAPAFEFRSPKDVTVENLCVRGGGVAVRTDTSASRFQFVGCRVEGTGSGTGFLLAAPPGTNGDISAQAFRDCEASKFASGFRWEGSNNLDPFVSHCTVTHCETGFDLREGGSNAVLAGVGGSYGGELIAVNGGYQVDVHVQSVEHFRTVIRTGGDDAGGYGQPTPQDFRAQSVRECIGPWLVVNKSGTVRVTASSIKGGKSAVAENRSSATPLMLILGDDAYGDVSKKGHVIVVGAGI